MKEMDPIEYQNRIKAARLLAEWEIGDRSWADRILWAFNNPEAAIRFVNEEKEVYP